MTASSMWGAVETYRRKRAARLAREKEAARQAELARNLDALERGALSIQEILDRAATFDAAWRPVKKPASK